MKIKSYKVFLVFSILYAVCLFATVYICYLIFGEIMEDLNVGAFKDAFNPFKFPDMWSNAAYILSLLVYLPGIIVITFCANEFSFKTHRQNIIDGWNRPQFLLGKMLLIFCFSIAITLIYILSVYIFSLIVKMDFSFKGAEAIGFFFLQTFYYLLFAFTLAILFRKSGVAIIVFLIFGLIGESILMGLINWKASPVGYFMPLQVADSLTPFYIPNPMKDAKDTTSIYRNVPGRLIMMGVTLGYTALLILLARKKFVKDDL